MSGRLTLGPISKNITEDDAFNLLMYFGDPENGARAFAELGWLNILSVLNWPVPSVSDAPLQSSKDEKAEAPTVMPAARLRARWHPSCCVNPHKNM